MNTTRSEHDSNLTSTPSIDDAIVRQTYVSSSMPPELSQVDDDASQQQEEQQTTQLTTTEQLAEQTAQTFDDIRKFKHRRVSDRFYANSAPFSLRLSSFCVNQFRFSMRKHRFSS
jgi:hypothetical protein